MKTHKNLIVWEKSIEFVTEIYKMTKFFPKEEIYGITNQMRRSAISIPSNISEGAARNHNKEFIQYLYIALGSASEIETQLIICKNLSFIDDNLYTKMNDKIIEICKLLSGLIKSVKIEKMNNKP